MVFQRKRSGFTLVELLIVVVVMAILAATIIPQFTDITGDAQSSASTMNLRTLRQQIEYYKAEHGQPPDATLDQLLIQTDANGNAGTEFGPYLQYIPENSFTGSNKVTATAADPPAAASGAADAGWLYNATKGKIWLDHKDYLTK